MNRPQNRSRSLVDVGMLALALGCLVAVGGCATQRHTVPGAITAVPERSFMSTWTADLGIDRDDEVASVNVFDDLVIVYTRNHAAYVVDRNTGILRWSAQATRKDIRLRTPIVMKDYVVFPTASTLEVYDRRGRLQRSWAVQMSNRSNGVALGTRIFIGADAGGGGRLICYDLTGSQYQPISVRWELQTLGGISAAPAIQQGLVYVADEQGNIYAVNADTRAPVWPLKEEGRLEGVFGVSGAVLGDVKSDDYGVYIASTDYFLYCCDRTSGRIRWKYGAARPIDHTPSITATTVYVPVTDLGLVAVEKTDAANRGKPRWSIPNATQFLAEDEKFAYLLRQDQAIMAVDRATGALAFVNQRRDFAAFGATGKGNVIYAATKDGVLKAIIAQTKSGAVGEVVRSASPAEPLAMAR